MNLVAGRDEAAVPVTMGSPRSHSREVGGLLVTEAHFPARLVLPQHIHERATVALMLEGCFDCTFPRRTLECQPGTLHVEPAEERHGNRMGQAGSHVLVIQPSSAATEELGARSRFLQQVQHHPRTIAAGFAWRLARELHRTDTAAPLAVEGLALEILAEAIRLESTRHQSPQIPRWLTQARDCIHASSARSLRLMDIASQVGVRPVRLARAFRRQFGHSLGSYARRIRLDRAATELAATTEPISAIAMRAGFADQSHFTRAFRAHVGCTPHRFREITTT